MVSIGPIEPVLAEANQALRNAKMSVVFLVPVADEVRGCTPQPPGPAVELVLDLVGHRADRDAGA